MLNNTYRRIQSICHNFKIRALTMLCVLIICIIVDACSPGRTGSRRRSARKLTPLVFKQHVPNVEELSLGASGPSEGRIWRDDARFKSLVPNYNSDIVFKDEEGTGVDRLMSRRCREKLDILAISVMNMWPGVRLRVTEGFDEDGHHSKYSLHYEGRAVAISTSDRDTSKYGMLARLAVDAGFDWVFYESRAHIYCSVKTESTVSGRFSGCFHGTSQIVTKTESKPLHSLKIGEEIVSGVHNNCLTYSRVIGFLHKDPFQKTNFIQIHTSSKNSLFVTKEHLMFRNGQEAVHAADVIPGDLVTIISPNGTIVMSTVISIKFTSRTGVYAPLTEDGTIVVNGILSSCYAVVRSHDLAHFAFWPLRLIYKLKDRMPEIVVGIYNFVLKYIWTCNGCETLKPQDNDEISYIHWYANMLCELSGVFVNN